MAKLLAPYSNAMQLGQGFNSYTQQICINDAVTPWPETKQDTAITTPSATSTPTGTDTQIAVAPQAVIPPAAAHMDTRHATMRNHNVSQIVSYSSRFVDKLSDITDAMNISASLSIQTSTVGGSINGSFIDSDKFKNSDLNFFVQVKVTNQSHVPKNLCCFNKIDKLPPKSFTDVYGDTYISGFEEGGELSALISVKVLDKAKTFAIKAKLEGTLGTPALTAKVSGGVELEKSALESQTETTISVNWSGGGQIKDENAIWTVNSLTLAAANFPDRVAETPQRTYARLTKYTALSDFYRKVDSYSPMNYESASLYSSALLDNYMDFKSMWKQIQLANSEVLNQRAELKEAVIPKEILGLQPPGSQPAQRALVAPDVPKTGGDQGLLPASADAKPVFVPNVIKYEPYPATTLGLEKARRDCRLEMIKIVKEVDAVTVKPEVALEPNRDDLFVSPSVFKHLLPVVTLFDGEPLDEKPLPLSNKLILGVSSAVIDDALFNVDPAFKPSELYGAAAKHALRHKKKAKTFSMGGSWGGSSKPTDASVTFNDLDTIDRTYVPIAIHYWDDGKRIVGLRTVYSNGKEISHGLCLGDPVKKLVLSSKGEDRMLLLSVGSSITDNQPTVNLVRIEDSNYVTHAHKSGERLNTSTDDIVTCRPPDDGFWSLRGFWGSWRTDGASTASGCTALGAVWGREATDPHVKDRKVIPKLHTMIGWLSPLLQESSAKHQDKAGTFRMSSFAGNITYTSPDYSFFNHIDNLDPSATDYKISRIQVWFETYHKYVQAVSVEWMNAKGEKKEIMNGNDKGVAESGRIEQQHYASNYVGRRIFAVSIFSGKANSQLAINVTGIELWSVPEKADGEVHGTDIRHDVLGDPSSAKVEQQEIKDQVPLMGDWVLQGFYGEFRVTYKLQRLGAVWGRI